MASPTEDGKKLQFDIPEVTPAKEGDKIGDKDVLMGEVDTEKLPAKRNFQIKQRAKRNFFKTKEPKELSFQFKTFVKLEVPKIVHKLEKYAETQ